MQPFNGNYTVTQEFKGPSVHDGLDLVALVDKSVHCVVEGTVVYAGWENPSNHAQGFGQYVAVRTAGNNIWYYGHLSSISVGLGAKVSTGHVLGIMGNTGHSTGPHLHICVRPNGVKANALNVANILGIKNCLGPVTYIHGDVSTVTTSKKIDTMTWAFKYDAGILELQKILHNKGYAVSIDGVAGPETYSAAKKFTINRGDQGPLTHWVQQRLMSKGYSVGSCGADGIAGTSTMQAIKCFQEDNDLGVGYLGGSDWYYLMK